MALLDFYSDPQTMALLGLSAGLLEAGGPSRMPVSLGQGLGRGLLMGGQLGQQTAEQQRRAEYLQAMTSNTQADAAHKQMLRAMGLDLFGGMPGQPNQPQAAPQGPPLNPMQQGHPQASVMASLPASVPMQPQAAPQADPTLRKMMGYHAAGGANLLPFYKEMNPAISWQDAGGQLVPTVPTGRAPGVAPIPKTAAPGSMPFEASDIGPPAYRDFLLKKGQAGAAQQVTNVNSFLPASEEAQKDFIKSTRTTYDALKQAPVALASIEKAKALIPGASGFMGPGGETLLEAAKFLNNRVGMTINTEGVKDAEELRTRIFFNIMDNLKKMDAQPSQMQQQIMMESLGKLGTDPNALPAVLDAFGDVIKGKVTLHNKEVQSAIERGVKFPYDPLIEIGGGAAPAVPDAPKPPKRIRYDARGNRIP